MPPGDDPHDLFDPRQAFAIRLKNMTDEELLQAWEETLQLENYINAQLNVRTTFAQEYERDILAELRLRQMRRMGLLRG